ncbi:hypothetical protein GCM10027416_00580 [Okibacterium endophyticum]
MNDPASPATPLLGLLLDVDGPIASPVSRSIAVPSIAEDLVTLANGGVPIAFNTGRSDAFLNDQVIPHLIAGGLADDVRVWGICEKGAVTARITSAGFGELDIDDELAMPRDFFDEVRGLVGERYRDVMFFDETKRAMVSVEQNIGTSAEQYAARRDRFDADAAAALRRFDLGFEWEGRTVENSAGAVEYRIDPTIISTDIESIRSGKDLGAEKFIRLLTADGGPMPTRWRTLGDSRTDYAMSDWLHAQGRQVVHVDVRPADGVPEKAYPIRHHSSLIHDDAGAAYLARWVQMMRGYAEDDDVIEASAPA